MATKSRLSSTNKKNAKAAVNDDIKLVRDLAAILEHADLGEIAFANKDVAIRLSRVNTPVVGLSAPTGPASINLTKSSGTDEIASDVTNPAEHPGAITSPMVGTVYTSPEPGAPSFISEGDDVKKGQTLLIVEAMKVMNPITADRAGKVDKILVQNAQPVEYGEPLVIIN